MIDKFDLRSVARIPFMLKILVNVLSDFACQYNSAVLKTPDTYRLMESFINKEIQSCAENIIHSKSIGEDQNFKEAYSLE